MEARTTIPQTTVTAGDWHFCYEVLPRVSRTFSQPILLLPLSLKEALTVGYLLCRVIDTIEDCGELREEERIRLLERFGSCVHSGLPSDALLLLVSGESTSPAERELIEGFPRVVGALHSLHPDDQTTVTRWATEMAGGMAQYCRKRSAVDFWAPSDLHELEDYCYFAAGTVGRMITDLFGDWLLRQGPFTTQAAAATQAAAVTELKQGLERHAEAFGTGLQMVNVVKDITEDFPRRLCYIPESICQQHGLSARALLQAGHRDGALRATQIIIDQARKHLREGLSYVLLLPKDPPGLRLFCLLPLLFARATLNVAERGEERLEPGNAVKISRLEVAEIIADCGRIYQDDQAIIDRFESAGERPL